MRPLCGTRPFAALALLAAAFGGPGEVRAASLTLACLDTGRAVEACRGAAQRFTADTGHEVRVVAADAAGRVALEQYETLFSVGSPRLDVIQFPEGWAPALAPDLAHLGEIPVPEAFVPGALEGARVDGRHVGWPQHLAIMFVFLRSDIVGEDVDLWSHLRERLLEAPADGASSLSLGAADPALFPFFLDWLYGIGGEDLEDREGVQAALDMLSKLVGPVAAPGITETKVDEAASAFAGGRAAALVARSTRSPAVRGSPVGDRVNATARPDFRGAPDEAPLLATVWHVGVSRHSASPDAAVALAEFLASEEVQRAGAVEFALAPTRRALYEEEGVRQAAPAIAEIAGVIDRLKGHPVARYGVAYLDVADGVAETVRAMLRGEVDVENAARRITRLARRAEGLTN